MSVVSNYLLRPQDTDSSRTCQSQGKNCAVQPKIFIGVIATYPGRSFYIVNCGWIVSDILEDTYAICCRLSWKLIHKRDVRLT